MDIPTPIYDLHTSTRKSCVERGYPYVNYIVHERVDNFIQYEYEYVDLGLAVFLHGYLDRDIKQRLQTQADGLTKLMGSLDGADEEKLSEDFKSFRKTATEAAKISGAVPEIEMMGRRLTEKYSSPNPRLLTIFQMIAGDNKEFLENSVGAVVQGTKALQDLFLVLFEKRSEEHRGRIESFLKLISAFAVVMVLKEIWLRDDAQSVFTRVGAVLARWHLRWPSMITVHPGYFYSSFLIGAGLSAVLGLYIIFDERWKLHWFKRILALLAPLVLSMFGWLKWPFPKWGLLGLLTGLALAALISIRVGGSSKRRFWFLLASLPFYTWLVLYVGCYLLNIVP